MIPSRVTGMKWFTDLNMVKNSKHKSKITVVWQSTLKMEVYMLQHETSDTAQTFRFDRWGQTIQDESIYTVNDRRFPTKVIQPLSENTEI